MFRITIIVFVLVATFVLVYGTENRKHLKKHVHWHKHGIHLHGSKRSPMDKNIVLFIKAPVNRGFKRSVLKIGMRRGVIATTAKQIAKLLGGSEEGGKIVIPKPDGCTITVNEQAKEITLDFRSEECKNTQSLAAVFKKLTGSALENDKLFTKAEKFNVDKIVLKNLGAENECEFTLSAKEQFQLFDGAKIQVKDGTLILGFSTKDGFSFAQLKLEFTGKLLLGSTTLSYMLKKDKGSKKGVFSTTADSVALADVYKAFTGKDPGSDATSTKFFTTTLSKLGLMGTIDEKRKGELIITGEATVEKSKAEVYVIVKKVPTKDPTIGVHFNLTGLTASTIVSTITGKKIDLKLPLLDDIKELSVQYANAEMTPDDPDLVKKLSELTAITTIPAGLVIKVGIEIPGTKSAGATGIQFNIEVKTGGEITVSLADAATVDLLVIMEKLIPDDIEKLKQVFPESVKVLFNTFKISTSGDIEISMATNGPINIGSEKKKTSFKSVTVKTFLVKRVKSVWSFELAGSGTFGKDKATVEIIIKKDGDAYTFQGLISQLTWQSIKSNYDVKNTELQDQYKPLQVTLDEAKVIITFQKAEAATSVSVTGIATFSDVAKANVEVHVAADKTTTGVSVGLLLQGGISSFLKALLKKEDKLDGLPHLINSMSFGMVIQSSGTKSVTDMYNNKALKEIAKSVGAAGGKIEAKVSKLPADCGKEEICKFLKNHKIEELKLTGTLTAAKLELSMELGLNDLVIVKDKVTLKKLKASLSLQVQEAQLKFQIEGDASLTLPTQPKATTLLDVKAALSVSSVGTIELSLTIPKWSKPFGVEALEIIDFKVAASVNLVTGIPGFDLGGNMTYGTIPEKMFNAVFAGGFHPETGSFYVYLKVTGKVTIGRILEAFYKDVPSIPAAIADTGFPEGFMISASFPKDQKILDGKETIQTGFAVSATLSIFGENIICEIVVNPKKELKVAAEFEKKLKFAGGLLIFENANDPNKGPKIAIEFNVEKKMFRIFASVKVQLLNVFGIGGTFEILQNQFTVKVSLTFLGITASWAVRATYSNKMTTEQNGFKTEFCLNTEKHQETMKDEINNRIEETNKEIDKETEDGNNLIKRANEAHNKKETERQRLERELKEEEQKFVEKKKAYDNQKKLVEEIDCEKKCANTKDSRY